jgi:Protein of unknown function (DUF3179)
MFITHFNKRFLLRSFIALSLLAIIIYVIETHAFPTEHNGFKISTPLIPVNEIHHGGPPRDGIPSIDQPAFISANDAQYLNDADQILGLIQNNIAKAYPIKILNWHEIVNDHDVMISYCPLCGTGMAFKSGNMDFGVSGLLYNSDMLLYDRQTESLWSQIMAQAISGPLKGYKLKMLAVEHTDWLNWKNKHPDTQVLSNHTGYSRNYSVSPYDQYSTSEKLYFPVNNQSRAFHPKEKVIGIQLNGKFKAYAFSELSQSNSSIIKDTFSNQQIEILFNAQHRSGTIKIRGKNFPVITAYWFAWYAFHPDTEIYRY